MDTGGSMSYFKHNPDISDGILGYFSEREHGNLFEFRLTHDAWALSHNLPHEISVGENEVRYAKVLKTVAYVCVDEYPDGTPRLEKWNINRTLYSED